MVTAGDRLVAELGLTSARWQTLGSIIEADRPQSVAWLAKDMGVSRQNLQRIINDLEGEGLVQFQPNPHHKRSPLIALTDQGRMLFESAMKLQIPWANDLAAGMDAEKIAIAHELIASLLARLER